VHKILSRIYGFVGGYPWTSFFLVCALVVFVSASISSCATSSLYEKRQRERQAQIQKLEQELSEQSARADENAHRATQIAEYNRKLAEESDQLKKELSELQISRKEAAKTHESKQKNLESISDYESLRNANCQLRRKLGYPCASQ
jgi:septal ring factor EnvC (AmiA/AmiB activator)